MKQIISLLLSCLTLMHCNNTDKRFFVYDEIDYYYNDIKEEKLSGLYDNQTKSEINTLKRKVILGDTPHSLSDLSFIKELPVLGYKKATIVKSVFPKIDEIFVEKTVTESVLTACVYVYRDILVFKKNNEVVGVAKICLGCLANEITGSLANTENFGQNGDYEKLGSLLQKQRK